MCPSIRPTFNTCGRTAAPGEVPLTGDDVRAADVISGLALIGQHAASHGRSMGRADPPKLNLGEGRAGVVGLNLCTKCRNETNRSALFISLISFCYLLQTLLNLIMSGRWILAQISILKSHKLKAYSVGLCICN